MKVLNVHPFQDGLRRNIAMLDRLGQEMESIHKSIEGLVAMEDVLKGEGGNAIRAFYADCHLPFHQFFTLFQGRFVAVLKQMEAALDTLEPDPSGYIQQDFLEGEIEQGLRHIAQLTGSLTDEANSIMNQVADIVSLPHLDDNEVQSGVRDATIKRDDTVTQLHEFDANQTMALTPIAENLLAMETWIRDIESMFQEGLTDVHFQADQWAALSSKNTLKTDLIQHTAAMAGLPVMTGVDGQPRTMLGALVAGENPLKFSYGFVDAPSTLYGASISTLPGMATYANLMAALNREISPDPNFVNNLKTRATVARSTAPVSGGAEFSAEEVAQLQAFLKNTDFDDPNRKSGLQKLPPYEEEITFEGMRKVLGGNGPGTPDGLAPYALGALNFFTEDIATMLSADATVAEKVEAAFFTFFKPAKLYDTVNDALKTGEKVKDAVKDTADSISDGSKKTKVDDLEKETATNSTVGEKSKGTVDVGKGASVADDIFKQGKKVVDKFNIDDAYVKPKHLSTTKGNGAKFLGDSKGAAEQILKDSMKNGTVQSITDNGLTKMGQQSYSVIIDAGKTIGTKGENLIKVVLSEDGGMLSAYPIK